MLLENDLEGGPIAGWEGAISSWSVTLFQPDTVQSFIVYAKKSSIADGAAFNLLGWFTLILEGHFKEVIFIQPR